MAKKLPDNVFKAFEKDRDPFPCSRVSQKLSITLGKAVEYYSIYIRGSKTEPPTKIKPLVIQKPPEKKTPKITAVVKLPDDKISSYNGDNSLIPEFSGTYSKELHKKITAASDSKTKWHLFNTEKV